MRQPEKFVCTICKKTHSKTHKNHYMSVKHGSDVCVYCADHLPKKAASRRSESFVCELCNTFFPSIADRANQYYYQSKKVLCLECRAKTKTRYKIKPFVEKEPLKFYYNLTEPITETIFPLGVDGLDQCLTLEMYNKMMTEFHRQKKEKKKCQSMK